MPISLMRMSGATPWPYFTYTGCSCGLTMPSGGKLQYLPRWLKVSLDSAFTTMSTNSPKYSRLAMSAGWSLFHGPTALSSLRILKFSTQRLIAAHQPDAEAAAQHVVHGGDVLGDAQGIVRRRHEAAGDDAQLLAVLAEPHRHQLGIVGDLQTFDLQVMLGVAEAEVAGIVGEAHVLGDLVQHALVELGLAPRHAGLELHPTADRAVHEQAEAHQNLMLLPDRGRPARLMSLERAGRPRSGKTKRRACKVPRRCLSGSASSAPDRDGSSARRSRPCSMARSNRCAGSRWPT